MFDPSSFANSTPLAHADISRDVLPRGGTSHVLRHIPTGPGPGPRPHWGPRLVLDSALGIRLRSVPCFCKSA
ncbi:hypothetical protein TNCV_2507281 [Trichonephila clavipes]|nr:hypothetical protein TNCV_2507281 [Trichonephila clavipes]